jgi:hypothetical protein
MSAGSFLSLTAVRGNGDVAWAAEEACAADLPDGTPHPDPVLAAKGWQVLDGIYQRVRRGEGDAA